MLDTVGYVWTRAVNPILAAVMRDRDNRPDIWPQSLRSDYHSASCQQGAVCARTTRERVLALFNLYAAHRDPVAQSAPGLCAKDRTGKSG